MTAKRFNLAYADYDWWAICDKENPTELGISGEDVVKLLNELHEEIEVCKQAYIEIKENAIYYKTKCGSLETGYLKLQKENEQLKKELFETSKELLWATSDEVDRALHYEDEVEELRKEIFE